MNCQFPRELPAAQQLSIPAHGGGVSIFSIEFGISKSEQDNGVGENAEVAPL